MWTVGLSGVGLGGGGEGTAWKGTGCSSASCRLQDPPHHLPEGWAGSSVKAPVLAASPPGEKAQARLTDGSLPGGERTGMFHLPLELEPTWTGGNGGPSF